MNSKFKLHCLLTFMMLTFTLGAFAQSLGAGTANIRYVSKQGKYANDGRTWATAKANIQDAINDLVDNGLTGEVWVAAGTYTPTESTESSGGSTLSMSFKIPAGIKVYGGFRGQEKDADGTVTYEGETKLADRQEVDVKSMGKYYKNYTILSGDLSQTAEFSWNTTKEQWTTSFYGNCYHVVTFATNGFDATTGRANANGGGSQSALLEGCIIEHGNANNTELTGHPHNAYGGGVYMVEGAHLKNCWVRECVASRNGGGIYMDGGGYIEHCMVSNSQALGLGTSYGYGGGVCMDGPDTYNNIPMIQRQSGIEGCVGRMGGGLAIIANDTQNNNQYKIACTAMLVANNTATTEAGGVYMNRGGAITQMTIVRNKCNGAGVTLNGMTTGRSAGVYCRDNAVLANSVLWGGACSANNDIQYASSRSGSSQSLRPYVMYTSLTKSDYTDWSGVIKNNVTKISENNTSAEGTANASEGYPMFNHPTPSAGYIHSQQQHQFFIPLDGQTVKDKDGKEVTLTGNDAKAYDFQPTSRSSLNHIGLAVVDIDRYGMTPAYQVDYDIVGTQYNPRPTLGGYTTTGITIRPQVDDTKKEVNFYVDPSNVSGEESADIGSSWNTPIRFLADALTFISDDQAKTTPDYCKSDYTINVYVKQGTVNNTTSRRYTRVRKTGFEIPSNVNILGGYPSTNTDTSISGRNPNVYMTYLTGNVQDDYDLNVIHLLRFNGTKNSVINGFSIRYANARSLIGRDDSGYTKGGAIAMYNAENIKILNCGIAGNTASEGAAAYIHGSTNIYFENCIFHNNESRTVDDKGNVTSNTGNVVVATGSDATFCHCDFLRNVGFAIDSYGKTKVVNSMFYANMNEPLEDTRSNEAKALMAVRLMTNDDGTRGTYEGNHNLYDVKSQGQPFMTGLDATNEAILTFTYSETSQTYPRFINPTKNAGVNTSGDATYYGRTISFMPHNNNPMVNRAATVDNTGSNNTDHTTWGTDMTGLVTRDYGGLPDIGALENHEVISIDDVDKKYSDGQKAYGTVMYVRDYNKYTYNTDGSVKSTTKDESTTHADGTARDGSSWANAINGNAPYTFTYTYSKTTTPSAVLTTPTASTLDSPTTFKIGMLYNNTPGNAVYYAKAVTGDFINSTTDVTAGDDFVLISDGSGYFYIYDLTAKKYVYYTQSSAGASTVKLSDSNTTNAKWRLRSINTGTKYRTYCIQPSVTSNSESSASWNYHGGPGNNLGLYSGSDSNGKWQFVTVSAPQTTTSTETKSINGLQYAVSSVESEMAKSYTTRTTVQSEASVAGTFTTAHTYQDLPDGYKEREVWVGAGIYTCTTGYEVRNHVKVYGAFPKTGTPGKNERHPQLTTDITLSTANQGFTVSDYETILQTNSTKGATTYNLSVLSQPLECRVTTDHNTNVPADRVVYEGAEWDGFTIRYGYKTGISPVGSGGGRDGGAGLRLYENVTVSNCVIRDNQMNANNGRGRGAAVYVDGSTITNCYIMNNTGLATGNELYGGGMYMIKGTIYNSVITGNTLSGSGTKFGAGAFFESADFFNNTVVNNTGAGSLEVWTASAAEAHLTLYNSIIIAGTNKLVDRGNSTVITFKNCFLQSTATSNSAKNNTDYLVDETNKWYCGSAYSAATYNPFAKSYTDAVNDYDFRIVQKDVYNAVNAGTQDITIGGTAITIPSSDMDYTDRVQDCEIDMGAFEYNGAYSIQPDTKTLSGAAIFYVTPEGRGNASATNPDNAACAAKLQKVLDAAGRYKFNTPAARVIVKVANSKSLADAGSYFKYYACRTTDANNDDVRIWSIIVPRGVEVWGGYTDTFTSSDDNGFYTKDSSGNVTDRRDITGNPTYFDSYYYNSSEKADAYTYHVVSFSDKVFDGDGNVYGTADYTASGLASSSTYTTGDYLSMKNKTTDRAVIDGIFITGGNADAKTATSEVNINQYGGAAIVTDYAHVRNCIVRNNEATYGGALALTHGALVSGCLIDQNTADYGGAIYVFENGAKLSDGTVIASKAGTGEAMDKNMAHVYTSTIVNNLANQQGGGIFFGQDDDNINIRVNSSVIWQNSSSNMANVSGLYNPTKTNETISTLEFFPFAYCGVQNLRMSGVNNLSLANLNKAGARFAWNESKTLAEETSDDGFAKYSTQFGYYALTDYSVFVHTGMPIVEYTDLVKNSGLSQADFKATDRLVSTSNNRTYIEMGARALDKIIKDGQLMLRLFVAQPEDIDMDAAQTMMGMAGTAASGSAEEYYSQEGSSFAYPMQSLQDALDYIIEKRTTLNEQKSGLKEEGANNLPFEICMGRGTYYPTRNTSGIYGNSPGNTFAIPEGVSIYGGFAVGNPDNGKSFFGRYYKKGTDITKITDNKTPGTIDGNVTKVDDADKTITLVNTYEIDQCSIDVMKPRRRSNDNNNNNIIEPWEFTNQTILSGAAEGITSSGVYHVVSCMADQNVVGMLPKQLNSHKDKTDTYKTKKYDDYLTGSFDYEEGQYVSLDGLQISDGFARSYIAGSTEFLDKYTFYCGGGLMVDGNRYCDGFNKSDNYESADFSKVEYKHDGLTGMVGYRDIPVNIVNCKFSDNEAGLGGALYSNGTLNIYKSSFEHNRTTRGEEVLKDADDNDRTVQYPGSGGAVFCAHQMGAYNTIFANNEAYSSVTDAKPTTYNDLAADGKVQLYGGVGGAVFAGPYAFFHLMNCDIVRNQANMYPAVFTLNPNPDLTGTRNGGVSLTGEYRPSSVYYNQIINSVVWGNDINSEMSKANDSNQLFKFNSRLICNYAKGSDDAWGTAQKDKKYDYKLPSFTDGDNLPKDQAALDANNDKAESDYGETAWFSAYEEGRGMTPYNDADFRASEYNPFEYARDMIHNAGQKLSPSVDTYQNCNILLSSENFDLEGPNFVNPSSSAGYEGYDEAADWSPARLTNLVDNGSGQISQTVELEKDKYKSEFNTYTDYTSLPARSVLYNYTTTGYPNASGYTSEAPGDYSTQGVYTTTRVLYGYDTHRANMPVGTEEYMTSAATGQKLYRISYDPNPTHNQTYIDIGVYEYPHTELSYSTLGDEVDILWVSPKEKADNGLPDGSDWSQPTSDFQRAIETLLASRNGHRKEIRLMDGTFTPIYKMNDHLAFYINTLDLNKSAILPATTDQAGETHYVTNEGVKSLTIKGGYSQDNNGVCDPAGYPAVIRQQTRSNTTGNRWDHLFYIDDATQRYGYDPTVGYNDNNDNGHYKVTGNNTYDKTITTIPLYIDGVTMVNNQAGKGVNGAAIYYADIADDDNITSPTQPLISANQYYTDDTYTEVSDNNEPTQYFKPMVDKYYTDDTYTTESDSETEFATYKYVEDTNENKIIISKTKVMNSGSFENGDYTTCAVYIGKNGGKALLYNDVMHSNTGNPLVSAVPTTIVNNTYALNNGHVNLNGENTHVLTLDLPQDESGNEDDGPMLAPHRPMRATAKMVQANGSCIFNSVFWRNNDDGLQFQLPGYVSEAASGDIFKRNAFTGGNTTAIDYNSTSTVATNNYNVGLSDENANIINGPNFTDPKLNAISDADIEARDFTLQPSLRLLNKGDNELYNDRVVDASGIITNNYNVYDISWSPSTRTDAGGNKRFFFDIDLGAYEYQNNLNRIIYVNPNDPTSGEGNSWASPIGYGNLQAAIDLAAIYHVNWPTEEAYVFVKGASTTNSNLHLGETITMRNGVSVYGSILPTRTGDCTYKLDGTTGEYQYNDDVINSYVNVIMQERAGIAALNANKTRVSGIKVATAATFDTGTGIASLVDGFDVTASTTDNPTGAVTAPVIDVQPKTGSAVLRNIIVHDNDISATEGTNLVNVDNALIYEALFRDNKVSDTGYDLALGSNGYGVNLTVDGKTRGADGTVTYNGKGADDHIYYSIVNYAGHPETENTLSGHNYKLANPDLNYQLTEQSKHIDEFDNVNPLKGVNDNLAGFIHYDNYTYTNDDDDEITQLRDCDILGNYRLLKGVTASNKIDRGAFETWKVEKDKKCRSTQGSSIYEMTYQQNEFSGEWSYIIGNTNIAISSPDFPQPGSVVYITKDKSLVLLNPSAFVNHPTPFTPGYLLLQDGASVYGKANNNRGNEVNVAYVGVERSMRADGSMVSLPYPMQYLGADVATNGVGAPSYDSNGVLTLTGSNNLEVYNYNGVGRSAWNSKFYDTKSDYWTAIADETIAANQGVLVVGAELRDATQQTATYRFTAQADPDDMTKYVYTETAGETSKTVTLTQHDDRTSTSGAADFTEKEDMGWNCIGLPYLVSDYNTVGNDYYTSALGDEATDGHYNMNIPHTLWLYYDGKTSPDGTDVDGDGGFYSVSSWDDTDWHLASGEQSRIWVGEGIFTQTSAVSDTEDLTFYRPVYNNNSGNNTGGSTKSRLDEGDDELQTRSARVNVRYYEGSDDVIEEKTGISIRARNHIVYISGLQGGESITICDASGRVYNMATATSANYSTAVPVSGIYIIKVDDTSKKVMIR